MNRRPTILLTILLTTILLTAQSPTAQPTPPKEVLERYFQMEANGQRLSPKGWRQADTFFFKPVLPPKDKQITVIYKDYSVWEPVMKGSTAELTVGYLPVGKIDAALRFTPAQYYKEGVTYRLVLTDKHWELGTGDTPAKEVTGPLAWRIEGPVAMLWITSDSAIKYVKEMFDKTNDPQIKQNAKKTLKVLQQHR